MLDQWYVRFRGRTTGPFPEPEVRAMLDRGQISRMHEVSGDGKNWTRLISHPQFNDEFAKRSAKADKVRHPTSTAATPPPREKTDPADEELEEEDFRSTDNHVPVSKPIDGPLPVNTEEAPPEDDIDAQWYYASGDDQIGPIEESVLRQMLGSSQLPPNTLVWKAGMKAWTPARHAGLTPPGLPGWIGKGPKEKAADGSSIDEESSFTLTVLGGYLCCVVSYFLFPIGFGAAGFLLAIINILRGQLVHGIVQMLLAGGGLWLGQNFAAM